MNIIEIENNVRNFVLSLPQCPSDNVRVGLVCGAANVVFDDNHLVQISFERKKDVEDAQYKEISEAIYQNINTLLEITKEFRGRYEWGKNYILSEEELKEFEYTHKWERKHIGLMTYAAMEIAEHVGQQVNAGNIPYHKWIEEVHRIMMEFEPLFYGQRGVMDMYTFDEFFQKGYEEGLEIDFGNF